MKDRTELKTENTILTLDKTGKVKKIKRNREIIISKMVTSHGIQQTNLNHLIAKSEPHN